ncbi:MAG: DUF1800 domain-containing protein [Candidatus Protistobacter heckmanni]|nr:DUF1800 domain-containing protein [Candidatus Protistobacter heckmanni]
MIALARVFTGWTINEAGMKRGDPPFAFAAERHDYGDKILLGQTIRGSGADEGEQAQDILAYHPATARCVALRLAQNFVSDQPAPALVERIARRFLEMRGDIRAMLRTLFDSPEFWAHANFHTLYKTPYRYLVSSLRAAAIPVANYKPADGLLFQLAMPMYGWLTPDGYAFSRDAWLKPDALLRRINFAVGLGGGRSPIGRAEGAQPPPGSGPLDARDLARTLGPGLSPDTLAGVMG